MPAATRKITKGQCTYWLENPQLSDAGKSYALGSPEKSSKWKKLMKDCKSSLEEYFNKIEDRFYTPDGLINEITRISTLANEVKILTDQGVNTAEKKALLDGSTINLVSRLDTALQGTENVEETKAYMSCLIITYGLIEEAYIPQTKTAEVTRQYNAYKDYLFSLYEIALQNIKSKYGDTHEFITLEQFKQLTNADFKERSTVKKEKAREKKCGVNVIESCSASFGQVKNPEFKQLADAIECHCSFFKQKLILVTDDNDITLFQKNAIHTISKTDINAIKEFHRIVEAHNPKPTIAIRKYPSANCQTKDYLFQLFAKCCSLFPSQFKPVVDTEEAYTTSHTLNLVTGSYYGGNLNVFHMNMEGYDQMSTVPVYFVDENNTVYYDIYKGPTKQLFNDIFHELLIHKVFVGMDTYFNNVRYVLNLDWDISKFAFYKELPSFLKTDAIKEKLTNYFYLFVGNLIHFAVANHMELPFKLSRAYIIKLFNILSFTKNNKGKMLLISIFLTEKSPMYTNAVLKLFKNPSDEEALMIVSTLYEPKKDINDHDKMINYLFETAYKSYFQNINNDDPIGDNMSLHPRVEHFFKGFTHYREYHNPDSTFKALKTYEIPTTVNIDVRLGLVRKLDYYLSGPGLNHDTIRTQLIPKIRYEYNDQYLYMFNNIDQVIHNIPAILAEPDKVTFKNIQHQIVFWLFRILLDKGRSMPAEFKTRLQKKFNFENLSDEEYHYEFVKLLLKTWSGVSYINNSAIYKINFTQTGNPGLPTTHTCFNELSLTRKYNNVEELYKDLCFLVTEGTNFGEVLAGGCSRCHKSKYHSKKRSGK